MKHIRIIIVLFACCSLVTAQIVSREYQVKAAFLFNFTQFVDWPTTKLQSAQAPFVIGILGKDPFGSHLKEIVAGESVGRHPLVIKHYNHIDQVVNCHLLYINISDKTSLQNAINRLKGKNTLTVSDAAAFPKMGGMIRLYTKEEKINIQINLDAAKAENISISSKLLKLAEIIKTEKN